MKRTVSEARVGENQVRYRVRLEDEETASGTDEANRRRYHFFQELANNFFALLQCGPTLFQKLNIYHAGDKWVAEAEALVDESRPNG